MNQYFGLTVAQTFEIVDGDEVIESIVGLGIVFAIQAIME